MFIFPIFSPEFLESINTSSSIIKVGWLETNWRKITKVGHIWLFRRVWWKKGKFRRAGVLNDYGILRAWGGESILEFPKARGVKMLKLSVIVYGYFLELPNPPYFCHLVSRATFPLYILYMMNGDQWKMQPYKGKGLAQGKTA